MDDAKVEAWLAPLDADASGADVEYEPAYLQLVQAANGRAETQFGAAEAPSWPLARELAESLLDRSRDLRVALLWTRALVNLEGLEGLARGLTLLHGLLDLSWDTLYPRPDPEDGDTFARLSTLGSLDSLDGLLGDVRQAQLLVDRRLGGLRVRDAEIALERLAPRADEKPISPLQVTGQIEAMPDLAARLAVALASALTRIDLLQALMNERFRHHSAVDLKALRGMLSSVQSLLPETPDTETAQGTEGEDAEPAEHESRRSGGMKSVESRQDAVRAIHLICAYLERSEPTNPAQQLLRRAERLIDKDFLHLVRDLAPDALREVARILGVDPESVTEKEP